MVDKICLYNQWIVTRRRNKSTQQRNNLNNLLHCLKLYIVNGEVMPRFQSILVVEVLLVISSCYDKREDEKWIMVNDQWHFLSAVSLLNLKREKQNENCAKIRFVAVG